MDRILQEILAVSRKLEGMDNAMVALTAETRSMRLDIAGFQSQISGLDQRVATVETQVASWTERDLELLHLRSKLTDLEDRSRRNNVRLLGFPEGVEGADIFSYLRDILPKLTDITFDPPLEFQRAHRLGPKRQDGNGCPSNYSLHATTFAGLQLLQTARTQGPLRSGNLEIRISADFSKETAERRKAFLSFRTQLRRLDVKFGLFEPARMWITKNGKSQIFYNPEDLRAFLEGLQDQTQSMEMTAQTPQDTQSIPSGTGHPAPTSEPELSHTLSKVPDPPQWIAMEKLLLSANEGLGGPYRDDLPSANSVNPILKATQAAWRRAHSLLGVHPLLHDQAPLWRNGGLRIGGEVLNWPQWKRAGIHTLSQILENDTL
ncbi:hypothetical protein NDU88_006486 [Pleurodeles waltl]|uniref:Uncharacterized protein n=1 Tax=Pleurodeles waltl TaxID=8319 RepID=A0AAV7TXE0_PLEWA|nr:hypothetical protein NDU88_006486 [Pleurodeles waltl]